MAQRTLSRAEDKPRQFYGQARHWRRALQSEFAYIYICVYISCMSVDSQWNVAMKFFNYLSTLKTAIFPRDPRICSLGEFVKIRRNTAVGN